MAMLICALAASYTGMAQGFIGTGGGGTTIGAVTSSGTVPNVNVGIGTTPSSVTTLEVAPTFSGSPLGLRFDQLPRQTDSTILYYEPSTGQVFYGPPPAGGVTSVDYECGVGRLIITPSVGSPFYSTYKAWLLSGSTTAPDSSDYFGTYNNDDIRINTINGSCAYDPSKQRMIITGGKASTSGNIGNVGIGMNDGTNNPTLPQNKLLVENGTIFNSPNPYSRVNTALSPFGLTLSPNQIGLLSVSNDPSGINLSMVGMVEHDDAPVSVGVGALVSGDKTGANPVNNEGFIAVVDGNNSSNNGANFIVGQASSTTQTNNGVSIHVTGSSFENIASSAMVSGTASGNNFGYNCDVTGSTIGNFGHNATVHGDNVTNTAVNGRAYGSSSIVGSPIIQNYGVHGRILATSGYNTNNICAAVYGDMEVNSDGYANFGVWGDLNTLTPPSSNTSVPYFAVYGTIPSYTTSGSTAPTSGSPFSNSYYTYAGYFEGDVFTANTYYYSDPKLKENIKVYAGALDQLKKLPVKSYTFRNSEYPKMGLPQGNQIGVLSTDLKEVFPNLVKGGIHPGRDKDDPKVTFEAVNYNALIPVLVEAVQELDAKTNTNPANDEVAKTIAAQQTQIAAQSQQLTEQSKQIADLRTMIEDLCSTGCAGFKPNVSPASGTSPVTGSAVLYQSTPNPTSGSAVIAYAINMPFTTATIQVSDKGGKAIRQYTIQQQGAGSVTFEGSAIAAAGSYTYSLIIDGRVYDTKSMVIVKD